MHFRLGRKGQINKTVRAHYSNRISGEGRLELLLIPTIFFKTTLSKSVLQMHSYKINCKMTK